MPRVIVTPRVPFAERAKFALAVGVIAGACTFGFGLPLGAFGFGAAAVANAAITSTLVGMLFGLSALAPRRRFIAHGHRAHHHTVPLVSPRAYVTPSVSSPRPGLFSSWLGSSSSHSPNARTSHTGNHTTMRAQPSGSINSSTHSTQHHTGSHSVRHYKK